MSLIRSSRNNIHSTLIMPNSPPFTRQGNGGERFILKTNHHTLLPWPLVLLGSFEKFPLGIMYDEKEYIKFACDINGDKEITIIDTTELQK